MPTSQPVDLPTEAGAEAQTAASASRDGDVRSVRLASAIARLLPPGSGVEVCRLEAGRSEPGLSLPAALRDAVPARRQEYLSGRWCALQALRSVGAADPLEIGIGPLRAPLWPPGYSGSISHSAGFAAAVAASSTLVRAMGLDLEALVAPEQAAPLRTMIGQAPEWTLLAQAGLDEIAFTLLFSAKEALFKCLAPEVGRYFDFLDVELATLQGALLTFALRVPLSADLPAGHRLTVGFGRVDDLLVCGLARLADPLAAPRDKR